MKNTKNKNPLHYIVPAIIVTLSILAAFVVLLKPTRLTKEVLESENFKEGLTERVKRLTGLDLTFDSLDARPDLSFRLKQVQISKEVSETVLHTCTSPEVTGKLSNEGQLFSIQMLDIGNLSCELTVNEDFAPMGITQNIAPGISDFDLLFGISLQDAVIHNFAVKLNRVHTSGQPLEQLTVQNARLGLGFDLTLAHQEIRLKIAHTENSVSNESGILLSRLEAARDDMPTLETFARFFTQSDLNYHSDTGVKGNFWAELSDQSMIPSYASQEFPAKLSFVFEGAGRFPKALQVRELNFEIPNITKIQTHPDTVSTLSILGFHGQSETPVLEFDFKSLEGATEPALASLLALDPQIYNGQLATFSNAELNGHVSFQGIRPQGFAIAKIPALALQPVGSELFSVNEITLRANFEPSPENTIDFKVSASAASAHYQPTAYHSTDLNFHAELSLIGDEKLEIRNARFDSSDIVTSAQFTGMIGWKDGIPSVVNAQGQVTQDLNLNILEEYQIDARASVPFAITTEPNGEFLVSLTLDAQAKEINHRQFTAEGVSVRVPIQARIAGGLPNHLLFTEAAGQALDGLVSAFESWNSEWVASVERLTIKPDIGDTLTSEKSNINLYGISTEGTASQQGFSFDNTASSGQLTISSYSAPRPDGIDNKKFETPVQISWNFVSLAQDIPGIELEGKLLNPALGDQLQARALLYLAGNTGLALEYSSQSDILKHIAFSVGLKSMSQFKNPRIEGKMLFADFFAPQKSENWQLMFMNFPYEGHVSGTATLNAEQIDLDAIENTKNVSVKDPQLKISHWGTSANQNMQAIMTSGEAQLDLLSGQSFKVADLKLAAHGTTALPFPAEKLSFKADLRTGQIRSLNDTSINVPEASLHISGQINKGTMLESVSASIFLEQTKVADLQGRIGSFYPLSGVDFSGEIRPALASIPTQTLSSLQASLSPGAMARIPFTLKSEQFLETTSAAIATAATLVPQTGHRIVAQGKIEAHGFNFNTHAQSVENVKLNIPFLFLFTVEDDNALFLEVDENLYARSNLDETGILKIWSSNLPKYVRTSAVAPSTGIARLDISEGALQYNAKILGNKFYLAGLEKSLIVKEEKAEKRLKDANLTLDNRGMILNLGGKDYEVKNPLIYKKD